MEHLPITLIVKAPNQQIEDQTIKCELSWTINKLKQHLSEVYPSKPPKHEQKLIYSGQLLTDTVTLKDVLRHYDGQETHTVHLVCTPKHTNINTNPTKPLPGPQMTPEPQPPQNVTNLNDNDVDPSDFNWTNNPGQMDPNQYAMQMAWMQQTYMQYMMQYMQLAANSYGQGQGVAVATPPPETPQPPQNGGAPGEQPAPAAVRGDPDNLQERDWLDIFYMLSRMMILFTVVYFYSSPLRFVFVLILAVAFYFYHIGFFRLNNNNINNNNNVTAEPAVQEEQTPSRLMVVWTFFATFFASLIPEIPNAV